MSAAFPIVGIGASAGGLEALQALLRALPADTGMGFVIVQHLSPEHASSLAEILARATRMPVCEVRDEPAVEPEGDLAEVPNGVEIVATGGASLCLYQTEEKPAHLHLAFTAENRQQVEAFYRAALKAGGKDNGAPGLRPHYHANYYAAFVIGPDGHNIEVVCHEPAA